MPDIEIVPAVAGKRLRQFIDLPYLLYAGDPNWVPPLRSQERAALDARHPFFQHAARELFLALRGGVPVGRIAAILDHNALPNQGRMVGSFGYFESIDDSGVVSALVSQARRWLNERGAPLMRGPFSPSSNYISGVLVEGFDDPPCIGMPYSRPYYDQSLTEAGLVKATDLLALRMTLDQLRGPKARRLLRFASGVPGLRMRSTDKRRWQRDTELLWDTYVRAWSANWGYAPPSIEEFRSIADQLMAFVDLRLIQFCEIEGKVVGMILACPDLNQALRRANGSLWPFGWWHISRVKSTATRARVLLLGVDPEWQSTGLAAAFLGLANLPGVDRYRDIEASWILEDNLAAVRGLDLLGARIYKRYRLYESS